MTDETRQPDPLGDVQPLPAYAGGDALPPLPPSSYDAVAGDHTAVPGEQLPDLPETAYAADSVPLEPAEPYAVPEGTDDPDGDVGGPADSAIDLSYLQAEHDQDGGDEAAQTDEVTP